MISLALGSGATIDLRFDKRSNISFGILNHKSGRKNCALRVEGVVDMPRGLQGGPWACGNCGRTFEIVRSTLRVAAQVSSTYASKFKRHGLKVIR